MVDGFCSNAQGNPEYVQWRVKFLCLKEAKLEPFKFISVLCYSRFVYSYLINTLIVNYTQL